MATTIYLARAMNARSIFQAYGETEYEALAILRDRIAVFQNCEYLSNQAEDMLADAHVFPMTTGTFMRTDKP